MPSSILPPALEGWHCGQSQLMLSLSAEKTRFWRTRWYVSLPVGSKPFWNGEGQEWVGRIRPLWGQGQRQSLMVNLEPAHVVCQYNLVFGPKTSLLDALSCGYNS